LAGADIVWWMTWVIPGDDYGVPECRYLLAGMTAITPVRPVRLLGHCELRSLLPVALAVLVQVEVWVPQRYSLGHMVGPRPVVALLYVVTSLALLWRDRRPLVVLAFILTAGAVEYLAFGAPEGLGSFLPPLFAFYAVGRYAPARDLLLAGPLVVLGLAVHELKDPQFQLSGSNAFFWVVLAAAWPLGHAFQRRATESEALAARTRELSVEQERLGREARAAERARIARELHDVVGHGLSVIVLQLVGALGLLEKGDTEAVHQRLLGSERSAREALGEMRRLLGLLDDGQQATHQPGLDQLERLVADTRAAGAQLDTAITGERRALPAGVDLAAFRILQESLTNVLKHARPPQASVRVCYEPDAITVEVRDRGCAHSDEPRPGARGVAGIRERVALYDGELELGPQPDGGYLVRARLPIGQ
jgi:signal transduction histidine kinase